MWSRPLPVNAFEHPTNKGSDPDTGQGTDHLEDLAGETQLPDFQTPTVNHATFI